MRTYFVVTASLLISTLVFCVAQTEGVRVPLPEQVMAAAVRNWEWYQYWLPSDRVMARFSPGKNVSVLTARSSLAVGICIRDLALCMGFQVGETNLLIPSGQWPMPDGLSTKRQILDFLETNLTSSTPAEPSESPLPNGSTAVHHIDVTKLAPIPSNQVRARDFVENDFDYKLPSPSPLRPTEQTDLKQLATLIHAELRRYFPAPKCGAGSATIPQFSRQDPWLYVFANFGACGQGILILSYRSTRGWTVAKLTMAPEDVSWFSRKILQSPLSTLPLD